MFTFGKSKPDASLSALEALRKAHYSLSSLPDAIRIPAMPGHDEIAAKPISEATIDDLAFAEDNGTTTAQHPCPGGQAP